MAKELFVEEMAKRGNIKLCEAERYYDLFLETFTHIIKTHGRMLFRGIGTFYLKEHKEKTARNLHTGEAVTVPKRKKLKFKMSEKFFR